MIYFLLVFLSFLFLLNIVGFLPTIFVQKKIKVNFFEVTFIRLFVGYILVITITSIYFTKLKSINFLFLFLFLIAVIDLFKYKTKQLQFKIPKLNQLITLLLISILVFCISFYSALTDHFPFYSFSNDYIFYSKISTSLITSGEENGLNFLSQLDDYYKGPEPYHFFDLWGGSLISRLFSINEYLGLRFVIYPTFFFCVILGIITYLKKVTPRNMLIVFFCTFFGGFFIPGMDDFFLFKNIKNFTSTLYNPNLLKLSYFYVFLLAAFLAYRKGLIIISILCLLGLTVSNVITAPTLIIVIPTILFQLLLTKNISKSVFINSVLVMASFFFLFTLFYYLNKSKETGPAGIEIGSPLKTIESVLSFQFEITQLNIVISSILLIFALYWPLAFFISKDNLTKKELFFRYFPLIAGILISLLIWAFLYFELNSSQIFYDFSLPILNLTGIFLIMKFLQSPVVFIDKKYVLNHLLILMVILFSSHFLINQFHRNSAKKYDVGYLTFVNEELKGAQIVASLKGEKDMLEVHSKYNAVYPLGNYLFLLNKKLNIINIGDEFTPIDSSSSIDLYRGKKAVKNGVFWRYLNKEENLNLKSGLRMYNFLNDYDIKYLLLSKNAYIPKDLKSKIRVLKKDPISGESIAILE